MRVCRKCNTSKPETEFYKNPSKSNPNRLRGDCKQCHQVKTAHIKRKLSEEAKAKMRAYGLINADKLKDARLRRVQGISMEQYLILLDKQKGVCAICNTPPTSKKGFDIDHDHTCCNNLNANKAGYACGKCVRGLLCHNCNVALGHFKDSVQLLSNAIHYLNQGKVLW